MFHSQFYPAIHGCLLGGACGDALGGDVEFLTRRQILDSYGVSGIREYRRDKSGFAQITDDTQMIVYTAGGLLNAGAKILKTSGSFSFDSRNLSVCAGEIWNAYLDWYCGQEEKSRPAPSTWFDRSDPALHASRAPGITCLRALEEGYPGSMEESINQSKGCGGIMRVAPVALFAGAPKNDSELRFLVQLGAESTALTHGHPLGYLSSAALTFIISRCIWNKGEKDLYVIVKEARDFLPSAFTDNGFVPKIQELIDRTMELARGSEPDSDCIRQLGGGWVGDEALAISLFCALRHSDDFPEAIISSVNHSGDSDSTGAITGNILGAFLTDTAIGPEWSRDLELDDLLAVLASDLDLLQQAIHDPAAPLPQEWKERYSPR